MTHKCPHGSAKQANVPGPPKPVLERGGECGLRFDVGRTLIAQRAGLENATPEGVLVRHGFTGKASLG